MSALFLETMKVTLCIWATTIGCPREDIRRFGLTCSCRSNCECISYNTVENVSHKMKCVSGKIVFCEWKEAVFEKYMSVYKTKKKKE
jgi:hypothetical protein